MVKHKVYKPLSTQLVALFSALAGSFFFGTIADKIVQGNIAGGTGWSDTASPNGILIFGFYLGLFFCISFAHFAFVKSPSRYYYMLIGLLLASSLILIDLFWLAVGYTAAGIGLGLLARRILELRKA